MPLSLDDVRARMYGDENTDPIVEHENQVTDECGQLKIAGIDDAGVYSDDLMMVNEGLAVRLWVKEPKDTEWRNNGLFDDWNDLHTWIYEL